MTAAEKFKYHQDPDTGVLIRSDFNLASFVYADTAEATLLDLFKKSSDLSIGSPELLAAIRDWPTEYHLSLARSNLLRGFDLSSFKSVLEIGCGCGAITRQLGELGLSVTAVEGSLARAAVARERCRDLSNVEVVCDNFESYPPSQRFDLVTLIGVLEYAPMFIASENPFEDMLTRAKSFLKPGGVLLIAIENLLGLKYFAGHEEDHVGKAFWGIQGLYGSKNAKTLGRAEMDRLLTKVGFTSSDYYYPFPDYKIPNVVLSERGVKNPSFKSADLIAGHDARSYNSRVDLAFDEALVWESLASNQLLPCMANSFLIWSSIDENSKRPRESWLAKQFSISQAAASIVTTTFVAGEGDAIVVCKGRGGFQPGESDSIDSQEAYIVGSNLLFIFRRAMAARGSLKEVAGSLKPWIDYIASVCDKTSSEWTQWKLPSSFFDCVPHNIIMRGNSAVFIDREDHNSLREQIDFSWVLIRGLGLALAKSCDFGVLDAYKAEDVVRLLAAEHGWVITDDLLQSAMACERSAVLGGVAPKDQPLYLEEFLRSTLTNRVRNLQQMYRESLVSKERPNSQPLSDANSLTARERDTVLRLLSEKIAALNYIQGEFDKLQRRAQQKETELALIHCSRAWRLTSWLRRLKRLIG